MAKNIRRTESEKQEVLNTWMCGNRTYKQISLLTDIPISTVRLIISDYMTEKMKSLEIKRSRGIQLQITL